MSAFPFDRSVPDTSRPNTIRSPSGNHAGAPSRRGSVVSRLISPDARSSVYRSPGSATAGSDELVGSIDVSATVTDCVVVVSAALGSGSIDTGATVPVGGADPTSDEAPP